MNQDLAYIAAARERGWITIEELLKLASGSPVDLGEAEELTRSAGIDLVEDREASPWDDLSKLAEDGPEAFSASGRRADRDEVGAASAAAAAAAEADELLAGGPAALYLREISRTPLLTAEEEVTLAKELEAGKAARARLDEGVSDPAERDRLEADLQVGDAARKRLIESNLRLVVSVARKYLGRGLSFLDLVQEGNIGLQRGVDKFDWRRGFRFSTYAYWWIRQAVSRAVAEQSRTIRLPVHIVEQLTKLYNVARELEIELGHPPTPAQIGERMGIDAERVREAFRAARVPISLETPIGEEQESTLADVIADAAARAPADQAEDEVLHQMLDSSLRERLTQREAEVLKLRFGLGDNRERTLAEVGQELGISRERARQLEGEALRKLRRDTPFKQRFKEYVE